MTDSHEITQPVPFQHWVRVAGVALMFALAIYTIKFWPTPVAEPKYNPLNLSAEQLAYQKEILDKKRGWVEVVKSEAGTLYLYKDKQQTYTKKRPHFLDKNDQPFLSEDEIEQVVREGPTQKPAWLLNSPETITIYEHKGAWLAIQTAVWMAASFLIAYGSLRKTKTEGWFVPIAYSCIALLGMSFAIYAGGIVALATFSFFVAAPLLLWRLTKLKE